MNLLTKSNIITIEKVIGISLHFQLQKNKNCLEEILKYHGKYKDFLAIINFMQLIQCNNMKSFLFGVKSIAHKRIAPRSYYTSVNERQLVKKHKLESGKYKQQQKEKYYLSSNDGKKFLSIDIKSANFTALKNISHKGKKRSRIDEEIWGDYFESLVPNYKQSGKVYTIPLCIYKSKYVRQFVLSGLTKLRYLWEIQNFDMLNKYLKLNLEFPFYVNSDEFIIEIPNFDEADKIIELLDLSKQFRARKFTLKSIQFDGEIRDRLVKIYDDNEKRLVNVVPDEYYELHKKYCK